jgi:peptidoglycan/xylan/chitin deacetylase (PgdA/CDA1 family)
VRADDAARVGLSSSRSDPNETVFDRQVALLKRRYRIISLEAALEMIAGKRPVEPYSVVITFDDGYADNATRALPILRKHTAPAAVFVTTGFVDRREPLWFDRLEYALRHCEAAKIDLHHDGWSETISAATEKERAAALKMLKPLCKRRGMAFTNAVCEQVEARGGARLADVLDDEDHYAPLTWDQARELVDHGVSIGAHTVNHEVLGVRDATTVVRELTEARRTIEERLGRPCDLFCYPNGQYGDFNEMTEREARSAGYRCALVTIPGFVDVGDNPFALKRLVIGDDKYDMLATLSGVRDWLGRRSRPIQSGVAPSAQTEHSVSCT